MTVDSLFLQSTETIAYPDKFYPAEIEVSHHQLRNFISTAYNDKLFYVNRYDIYVLDLSTSERFVLVTVPFEARCLSAAHGWVCVGGETKGDCAFIYIGENDGQPGMFCHELLVEMLGKEIVNAMTVQMLVPELDGQKEEVVVLISNNDHTVTIYSLTRREVLATIEHPQPMNYAVLSPDSTIMAAVGDENKVYFMKRFLDSEDCTSTSDERGYPNYDWRPLSAPDVPSGIPQPEDFSFAVTFSVDGRLCAVSSQGGAITIFDMEAIAEEVDPPEDAILCTFRSSRASLWGCVRSMAFSPARWDVLAWAEDHGRIGMADVRQGFRRRQHVELRKDNASKVDVKDITPTGWKDLDVKERLRQQHQQRMQALRGHPPLGARSFNDAQRRYSSTEHLVPDQVHTLSDRERSIIQTLETTIDEIDNVPGPYSINYTATQPSLRPSASQLESTREYEVQLLNPSARLVSSHGPRRRQSVVLSESHTSHSQHLAVDETARMTMTASPGPMSDDGLPPLMSTNDLTPSRESVSSQPMPYNIPPSDPWHVIEASVAARRNLSASGLRPPSSLRHIEDAIYAERQLADRLERQLHDERRLSTLLRSELEARERLLEARQQELESERAGHSPMSPSLERLLQRQLHSERDHGQRRSEELEVEIRNMSRRVNQLMDERDSLLQRYRAVQGQPSSESAQTTALPTSLTLPRQTELERRMQSMEDDRRARAQRISDLEHQVRRAESRVELTSIQSNIVTEGSRPRPHDREESSILTSRILPLPASSPSGNASDARRLLESFDHLPSLSPTAARRLRHRTAAEVGLSSTGNRATIPRISELANRVTDNDLRLARMMMMRNNADGNGNWTPAAAHRFLTGQTPAQSQSGGASSLEDIIRESGVGTAGIGWSPDGLKLFAGSEHGIFEFKLNVQDRMQCPVVEMR